MMYLPRPAIARTVHEQHFAHYESHLQTWGPCWLRFALPGLGVGLPVPGTLHVAGSKRRRGAACTKNFSGSGPVAWHNMRPDALSATVHRLPGSDTT